MRVIDGARGGGQILRTSLALSIVTGEPFAIERIRAGRRRPGLMRQHLTSVRAAATVGAAELEGDELGSESVTFRPTGVVAGDHSFHVSTAGSAGLVLQTVLPPLLTASAPSQIELRGGTHAAWAPPYDFLERTFLPVVARMGPTLSSKLTRHGFYPAGGGRFEVTIEPSAELGRLELLDRGEVHAMSGTVLSAGLAPGIAHREARELVERTGWDADAFRVLELPKRHGPGNALFVVVESEACAAVFTSFGRKGVAARTVAHDAADQALRYLASGAPVGPHLADQLLVPLAIGAGGAFRTSRPLDEHLTTNAALIREWLGVSIEIEEESETTAVVEVAAR